MSDRPLLTLEQSFELALQEAAGYDLPDEMKRAREEIARDVESFGLVTLDHLHRWVYHV